MNRFEIKPIPVKIPKSKVEVDDMIMTTNTLVIAPTGSGKTLALVNLIVRKIYKLCYYYKRIYIVSPTLDFDYNYKLIEKLKPKKSIAEYVLISDFEDIDAVIEDILNEAAEDPEEYKLVILDDCLSLFHGNLPMLQKLYVAGRHTRLSTFCCSQSFSKVPRVCRLNSMNMMIFKVAPNELKLLEQEVGDDMFVDKYKEVVKKKYSFIVVRMREAEDKKYSNCFLKYI